MMYMYLIYSSYYVKSNIIKFISKSQLRWANISCRIEEEDVPQGHNQRNWKVVQLQRSIQLLKKRCPTTKKIN